MASLMTAAYRTDGGVARRPLLGRRWWRLWSLVANLVICAGIAIAWRYPLWRIAAVAYEGPPVWEATARACVVLPADSNFVRIDIDAIEKRLTDAFAHCADARVKLQLPDILSVRLEPIAPALWLSAQTGVGADGNVLAKPVVSPSRPTLRLPPKQRSRTAQTSPEEAAGLWAEVLAAEDRFREITSEWRFDLQEGWTVIAADGQTRFLLGRSHVGRRAAVAAAWLSQLDSTLTLPRHIDLRFDGQVVTRSRNEGHQAQLEDDQRTGARPTRHQTRGNAAGEGKGA